MNQKSTNVPLPLPALLKADGNGRISLNITEGQTLWRDTPTRTWGYNGSLLGPTLYLRRGQDVTIDVRNSLPESTAMHWHGLEIPGISDGGPQAIIESGALWSARMRIDQRAATCWYHPHPHGKTGRHVAMGLGGLLIIEDEESAALPLPRTWGVDDIPVVLQDKRLNGAYQIDYAMDVVSASVGWFGDMLLTNGARYPKHVAPKGWLRLRLLNGCNARTLRLSCSDNRTIHVIASDGGFLAEPIEVTELTLYTGERFEVMLDASDGRPFDLVALPVTQTAMALPPFDEAVAALRIVPSGQNGHKTLPDTLVPLPKMPAISNLPVRTLQLSMDPGLDTQGMNELMRRYGEKAMSGMKMGGGGSMDGAMETMATTGTATAMDAPTPQSLELWSANHINGKAFAMNTVAFDVKQGQYERWLISGVGDSMLHPFHIHGTQFRILKENGAVPALHRRGLKDTVFVDGKESEVLVRFAHPASTEQMYMAHCHLLEHADTGMMLSFTVTE